MTLSPLSSALKYSSYPYQSSPHPVAGEDTEEWGAVYRKGDVLARVARNKLLVN